MTEKADIQSNPKKSDKKWKWQKDGQGAKRVEKDVKGEEERKKIVKKVGITETDRKKARKTGDKS